MNALEQLRFRLDLKQRFQLPTCLLALVLSAGCAPPDSSQSEDVIFVSGRIEGDETLLSSKLPGRVEEVLAREGDRVEAGDVLVRLAGKQVSARGDQAQASLRTAQSQLERARLQLPVLDERLRQLGLREEQARREAAGRVVQAQGQLAATRAELTRAKSELDQARADSARYRELAAKGAAPKQLAEQSASKVEAVQAVADAAGRQVAAAKGTIEVARAAERNPEILAAEKSVLERQMAEARSMTRVAQAQTEVAEAQVAQAEADVEDLEIQAPFAGTVITRGVEPGQVVAPGQTLLTLADLGQIYLRAFVPEGQIGHVKLGQQANVYLDSAPEEAIAAEVIRVDPSAMFTPENTYFREDRVRQVVGVKLLLRGGEGRAKLGMPADGEILLGSTERPKP